VPVPPQFESAVPDRRPGGTGGRNQDCAHFFRGSSCCSRSFRACERTQEARPNRPIGSEQDYSCDSRRVTRRKHVPQLAPLVPALTIELFSEACCLLQHSLARARDPNQRPATRRRCTRSLGDRTRSVGRGRTAQRNPPATDPRAGRQGDPQGHALGRRKRPGQLRARARPSPR
jgi:hypothetical protein